MGGIELAHPNSSPFLFHQIDQTDDAFRFGYPAVHPRSWRVDTSTPTRRAGFGRKYRTIECHVREPRNAAYVSRLDWASHSSDMNPIENVWFMWGRALGQGTHTMPSTHRKTPLHRSHALDPKLVRPWFPYMLHTTRERTLSGRPRTNATSY